MSAAQSAGWLAQNQAYLIRAFAALRRRLGDDAEGSPIEENAPPPMAPPAAIDALAETFALSAFERALLLLCAGVEMDAALAARCGQISSQSRPGEVTFALALGALEGPHWSALAPSGPLRRFRLIEMEPSHGVTSAPLRIDERILHYLAGLNRIDPRLDGLLYQKPRPQRLAPDHQRLWEQTIQPAVEHMSPAIVLHLFGDDPAAQEDIAAAIAQRAGRALFVLRLDDTPTAAAEIDQFVQLWTREARLLPASLLLQWEGDAPTAPARMLAERLPGVVMIASRDSIRLHRRIERHEVNKPGPASQRQLWKEALGSAGENLNEPVDAVAAQFRLSADTIATIAASLPAAAPNGGNALGAQLWNACRSFSRPRLEALAERIVPRAQWDDLVLPELQKETLRRLAAQARHRMTVYETWGFAAKGRRGLGLSALFAGPSGTGKTLAAEVVAGDLNLDLYRIDLSSVVSKYIGETEKNLKQLFDAAEAGGVLLLFDEADALFGKRAEVKDSHDRYANIEVSYLLQRMESFQGLAILTTNLKSSLDRAFQRRLRFTVDFPFPDEVQRKAIWARVFPPQTPTDSLQSDLLARLNMTGGNIRNIALNAAFLAAESGGAVEMAHLLQAARMEAIKIERPLSSIEVRGWT
jgi:hypothetical protein